MRGPVPVRGLVVGVLLVAVVSLVGCAGIEEDPSTPGTSSAARSEPSASDSGALEVPEAARNSDGGGDPRPAAYWQVWNTCAPENRAGEARAAGWIVLDDVLADPGLALGDHAVPTCNEAVALLSGRTAAGEPSTDPAYALAGALLAAELNLNVGAESCPAIEEAAVGGHLILSSANFDGVSPSPLTGEVAGSLPVIADLLAEYNSGQLCR